MRAIVQDRYGETDVLRLAEIAPPTLGPHDVLVQMRAAGVNMADWHLMTGTPRLMRLGSGFRAPRQTTRGIDVAGEVVAVGDDVTRFAVGDEVFGCGAGSFAELVRSHEKRLAHTPAGTTSSEAAAVPTAGFAAIKALRTGGVAPDASVLVIGAGGGVGSLSVLLAVAAGARVTGVCSTAKVDLVRGLGAEQVVDYTQEEITASGQRFDLVLDVAGNRSLSTLRSVLSPRGTLVLVGGEGGGPITGGTGRQLRAAALSPFVRPRLKSLVSLEDPADLERLRAMLADGTLRPAVEREFPLDDTAAAIDHVSQGRAAGKVVVTA